MEFPDPTHYEDWKQWGRQLLMQIKRIPILERQEEGWRNMTTEAILYSGWANMSVWTPAVFWKDPNGWVHFMGALKKVGAPLNDPMFILPVGYRPMHFLHKWQVATNASVQINSDGIAYWNSGISTAVYLGAITFRTSAYTT